MKYWEIIADRYAQRGWSYGIAERLTRHGFLFCVDAHRDGKRFIVARTSPRSTPLNLGTEVSSVGASLILFFKDLDGYEVGDGV